MEGYRAVTRISGTERTPNTATRQLRIAAAGAACALLLQGCVWVRLSDDAAQVRQASSEDVRQCQAVGTVNAHTLNRVVFQRSRAKVQEELIVLASNEAAGLGGNRLVPMGPPDGAKQAFRVYRCP
jgi:hypothetical protein